MQVKINGKAEEISGGTVLDLLQAKKIEPQMVAVEVNDTMLDRNHLATTSLSDGDRSSSCFIWEVAGDDDYAQRHYRTHRADSPRPSKPVVPCRRGDDLWKVEFFNPGGSVKDRICLNMIDEAERLGALKPGGTIVEPTSGNTGIGLALVAAVRGYKLILVMPESMSMERASLLSSYGAQLVLTPAWEGMKGAIRESESIIAQNPSYFMPDQFSNPANPAMHKKTTALEILESLDGKIDAFVAAVGTGGTITGCGEVFKDRIPNVKVIAVEPAGSPVLSGGEPGPHKIQGIGAGFIPKC